MSRNRIHYTSLLFQKKSFYMLELRTSTTCLSDMSHLPHKVETRQRCCALSCCFHSAPPVKRWEQVEIIRYFLGKMCRLMLPFIPSPFGFHPFFLSGSTFVQAHSSILNDTNAIGHIQGIIVLGQANVSFLFPWQRLCKPGGASCPRVRNLSRHQRNAGVLTLEF